MRLAVVIAASIVALVFAPQPAHAQARCHAGELALPTVNAGWTSTRPQEIPPGREGCIATRVAKPDAVGRVYFRATPKGTPAIADLPHPRLLQETTAWLTDADILIGEPKWRTLDVPFSGVGMEGFGSGTMFGFDGLTEDGDAAWDVVFVVFDGPAFHYDVTLVSVSERSAPDAFKQNVAGFRAILTGLNRITQKTPPSR